MTDETIEQNQLRELLARTAQLPREIEPPADAWEGIRTAIAMPQRPRVAFWQRPAFLLAASLLLVAGSSLVTTLAMSGRTSGNSVAVTPGESARELVSHDDDAPATLAEFTARENDYISTANRLEAMIESDRVQLAPQTLEKLKESVRVIDAAILEARRALAEDPANTQLMEMLSTSYSQKVDLLERTAQMGRS